MTKSTFTRILNSFFALMLVLGLSPIFPAYAEDKDSSDTSISVTTTDIEEAIISDGDIDTTVEPKEDTNGESVETEVEIEPDTSASEQPLSSQPTNNPVVLDNANDGTAYVSALIVREQTDGLGPFDSDNSAGNDSNNHNLIVRSFDSINYTLEYTTELSDPQITASGAVLDATFTLPLAPDKAQFDNQTLNWMTDKVLTYTYSDGTISTKWDKTKQVTLQTLTGKRILEGKSTDDCVPGAGQLSVGIAVKAAPNKTVIQPSFQLQSEHTEQDKTTKPKAVTVSALGRYNIVHKYSYGESARNPVYPDFDNGTVSLTDVNGREKGRVYTSAVGLALWNTSADKGLKGLELPQGDITFDLRTTTTLNGKDVTGDKTYGARLWDYHVSSYEGYGNMGRKMNIAKPSDTFAWGADLPYGVLNGPNANGLYAGVYNSGNITAIQDVSDPHLLHVTIKNYQFDTDNWTFPYLANEHGVNDGKHFSDNIGFFSVGTFQYFARYPRAVDSTQNYRISTVAENMHITSESGVNVTKEERTNDNSVSNQVVLYAPGSFQKHIYHEGDSYWNGDDAWVAVGGTKKVRTMFSYSGTDLIKAYDCLIKFDTVAFEATSDVSSYGDMPEDIIGSRNVWFAAKPDGTGWSSDTEMNRTREEGLLFYKSLYELQNSGKICVGVLSEIRDAQILASRDMHRLDINLKCKDNAEPGYVSPAVSDVRIWTSTGSPGSVSNTVNKDGSVGIGDSNWVEGTYPNGYTPPDLHQWYDYEKQIYKDGTLAGGHKGGNQWGHSCLIVGGKNSISISNADKGILGTPKSTYDLDAGERTATFTISPKVGLASANGSTTGTGQRCDATVTVTLPKGLTYKSGSSTYELDSVKENPDGTTTLVATYHDVVVGKEIDAFNISCSIGAAGTNHDVANNEQLTITAKITSTVDQRRTLKGNGNLSECSISVVRLAAVSASKTVTPEESNLGSPHTWTLNFGNSSQTDISNCILADLMPYNGDGRGSAFHGDYRVNKIELDLSHAPRLKAQLANATPLSYSGDNVVRTESADAIANGTTHASFTSLGTPTRDGDKLVWDGLSLTSEQVKAFKLDLGNFYGNEYISVSVGVKTADENGNLLTSSNGDTQQSGDVYANNLAEYANGQAAVVHSNTAKTQIQTADFTVTKNWVGDENHEQFRPNSVTVEAIGSDGRTYRAELNKDNGWTVSFNNLPRFDNDGNKITYSVNEPSVSEDYTSSVSGSEEDGFTITNAYIYSASGTFALIGNKTITGRDFEVGDLLTFNVKGSVEGEPNINCPMPNGVDNNGNVTIEPTSGTKTKLDFGTVSSDSSLEGKTLVYHFSEKAVQGRNLSKDTKTCTVNVKVSDPNHDGTLAFETLGDEISFNNTFTPDAVSGSFNMSKLLTGREWTGADCFGVSIEPVASDSITSEEAKEAMPDCTNLAFRAPAQGDTSNVSVNGFSFKKAGIYTYRITENVPGEKKGIAYDSSVYTVMFTVTQDPHSGNLSVSQNTNSLTFENNYSTSGTLSGIDNLNITKILVGREWKDTDLFDFKLSAADEITSNALLSGKVSFNNDSVELSAANQTAAFGDIEFSFPGTYKFSITEQQHSINGVDISSPITLTVKAIDNGDGTITALVISGNTNPIFTDTYGANTTAKIDIKGKLLLSHEGYEVLPDIAEKYSFRLKGVNGSPLQEVNINAVNDADGTIDFGSMTFTMDDMANVPTASDGTRTLSLAYEISQDGEIDGISNDINQIIYFDIVDDGEGNLIIRSSGSNNGLFSFTNTFSSQGTSEIHGNKIFDNQPDNFDNFFTFELTPNDKTTKNALLAGEVVIPNRISDVKGAGEYSFDGITFNRAGTYTFDLFEHENSKMGGVDFDTTHRTITFTVSETATSKLNVATSVEGALDFHNVYTASGTVDLSATKVLEGSDLQENQFEFVLVNKDGKEISSAKNDANGNIAFKAIEYTQDDSNKTFEYGIYEQKGTDETITYDDSIHHAKVKVSDNGDGTLNCDVAYDGDNIIPPTFHNTYTEPSSPISEIAQTMGLTKTSDMLGLLAIIVIGVTLIAMAIGAVAYRNKRISKKFNVKSKEEIKD